MMRERPGCVNYIRSRERLLSRKSGALCVVAVKPPPPQPAQGRTHFPPFKGGFEVDETSSPPLQ